MKRIRAASVAEQVESRAAVLLALVVVAVVGIFHAQIIDGFVTARDSLVRTFAFGFVPTLTMGCSARPSRYGSGAICL